jgi:hypothetical protein
MLQASIPERWQGELDQDGDTLLRKCAEELFAAEATVKRLRAWISDLQSGMYVNCIYCGYRYGPNSEVPASMADVLKQHIEQCPEHPMSALKARVEELDRELGDAREVLFGGRGELGEPSWVLYIDLPNGQASFHSKDRFKGPDYLGQFDGAEGASEARICAFCDSVSFPVLKGNS